MHKQEDSTSGMLKRLSLGKGMLRGRPSLVVAGGDSCSEGRGFKSLHHGWTYISCKNRNVYLKRR